MKIINAEAYTILDSTGNPTIRVELIDERNNKGCGAAPRGSTIGGYECKQIYNKREKSSLNFVDKAISLFNKYIKPNIINKDFKNFKEFDEKLILIDGSEEKNVVGGNTTLAASIAFCELESRNKGIELYEIFNTNNKKFPKLMLNLVDGTVGSNLKGIEFLVLSDSDNIQQQIFLAKEIYNNLEEVLLKSNRSLAYSNQGALQMCDYSIDSILNIINSVSGEFKIGLDMAMSDRRVTNTDNYEIQLESVSIISEKDLINTYVDWKNKHNIYYIEDGVAEDSLDGWQSLMNDLNSILISGDDLYASNKKRIDKYEKLANSVVIKPNQVGTISETIDSIILASKQNKELIISQRTSEIENNIIADIAYAYGVDYAKFGGLNRNDRISKYNRLLEISMIEGRKNEIRINK